MAAFKTGVFLKASVESANTATFVVVAGTGLSHTQATYTKAIQLAPIFRLA